MSSKLKRSQYMIDLKSLFSKKVENPFYGYQNKYREIYNDVKYSFCDHCINNKLCEERVFSILHVWITFSKVDIDIIILKESVINILKNHCKYELERLVYEQ